MTSIQQSIRSFQNDCIEKTVEDLGRSPFLSVIIRTQGSRPEMLKENFLCLQAQTDQNFEILLILHSEDDEKIASVKNLIASSLPSFASKIRLFTLKEGTRTEPLNLGLKEAHGAYIAFYDDDDLLFDHWVDAFHKGALSHPGRIIRSYGVTQRWKADVAENGQTVLFSAGTIKDEYCAPFHFLNQLSENFTPISCVAFPVAACRMANLQFNDTLTTAEDWDFLMRCATVFSVFDTKERTFLYRLWETKDTSKTLHKPKEWLENRKKIIAELNSLPILTSREALLAFDERDAGPLPKQNALKASFFSEQDLVACSLGKTLGKIGKLLWNYVKVKLRCRRYLQIIRKSDFFDGKWYLEHYSDVRETGSDPARHYLLYGWTELRDPSARFSTREYLENNTDVASAGMCPLLHYETSGRQEGRVW